MTDRIITGDALTELAKMEANFIDTVICDPPYGLKFMLGPKNPWDYEVPKVEVWAECLRVAKPGATLLCFAGTRTQHRMAVNIEDAGWRLVDCLMWLYSQGFPKATDISKQIDKKAKVKRKIIGVAGKSGSKRNSMAGDFVGGEYMKSAPATPEAQLWDGWKSHGLKPAYEPIILAMKPNDGSYADNALKWGVGGLWIDGGRIGCMTENEIARSGKSTTGIFAKGGVDWKRSGRKPQGRYPSNLILDEEAARLLDETTGISHSVQRVGKRAGKEAGRLGSFVGQDQVVMGHNDSGGASRFSKVIEPDEEFLRFKYCAKASKRERGEGNDHPTVKPLALMQYLCRLTKTPTGGIVLDPFCGSGSTLVAAQREDRGFIGIDQDPKWTAVARRRIEADAPLLTRVEEK